MSRDGPGMGIFKQHAEDPDACSSNVLMGRMNRPHQEDWLAFLSALTQAMRTQTKQLKMEGLRGSTLPLTSIDPDHVQGDSRGLKTADSDQSEARLRVLN